jgi:hypothetical protein
MVAEGASAGDDRESEKGEKQSVPAFLPLNHCVIGGRCD